MFCARATTHINYICNNMHNNVLELTPFSVSNKVWCLPQATSMTLPMSSVFTGVLVIITLELPSSTTAQWPRPQLSALLGVNWFFQVSAVWVICRCMSGHGPRDSITQTICTKVTINCCSLAVCYKIIYHIKPKMYSLIKKKHIIIFI